MGIKDGLRNIRWVTSVKFASMALFGAWSLGFAWILLAQPAETKNVFISRRGEQSIDPRGSIRQRARAS